MVNELTPQAAQARLKKYHANPRDPLYLQMKSDNADIRAGAWAEICHLVVEADEPDSTPVEPQNTQPTSLVAKVAAG